ncbi:MAG: hypothetical protein U1G07_05345 [Verrucomicrobiota bacterium]
MSETAPKAELMRSLRRLVRGLSILFWGLPLTLLVCVRTTLSDWLRPIGILPPILTTVLLLYALFQLGYFQRQERVWVHALDRAKLLAVINIGLSPFVFWWNQLPHVPFFFLAVAILMLSGLLFLFNLNFVLQRLAAMLPDETLRMETKFFTSFNLYLLVAVLAFVALYIGLQQINSLPVLVVQVIHAIESSRQWLLVFLILLPLAMTMTLIWKIKEVVLASVFEGAA